VKQSKKILRAGMAHSSQVNTCTMKAPVNNRAGDQFKTMCIQSRKFFSSAGEMSWRLPLRASI